MNDEFAASLTTNTTSGIVKVARYLVKLAAEKFYGKVTLVYEQGTIKMVRLDKSIRPDDLED